MKALRVLAATSALLMGSAGAAEARDPGDGQPPGPTCYGRSYSYHIWNLVHPMTAYGTTSCAITRALALRASNASFLQFSSGLTTLVSPHAGAAGSLLTVLYNMNTDALRLCAVRGTGVELVTSNLNGMVIQCKAQ